MNCPTPHINANKGDFAESVLMPGDPKRSRFIAENFLTSAKQVNDVRGVEGWTGFYKGAPVSVMASGMGMPSIGIYSYELFNAFGVENIIRVGSCGAYLPEVRVRDIVLAQGACTDSNYQQQFGLGGSFAPIANFSLLQKAAMVCKEKALPFHVGNVVSSDIFYHDTEGLADHQLAHNRWGKMGVLAVEMEAAALYMNAARAGKKALCICTVSDSLVTGEALDALQRQNSFTDMINVALETVV